MVKRVAFINGKGGCGKSHSVIHVSGVIAKRGQKCLVIDMDKQCNATSTLLLNIEEEDQPKYTILDFLRGECEPSECTAKTLFQTRSNAAAKYYGVDVMVSDEALKDEIELADLDGAAAGEKLEAFIKEQGYDWVLVDMPPSNEALNRICFRYFVDYTIIPLSSDLYSVKGYSDIMHVMDEARQENPGLNVLGVYFSRYMANCGVDKYVRSEMLAFDNFIDVQIPLTTEIREAIMFGRPISFYKGRTATEWVSEEKLQWMQDEGSITEVLGEKKGSILNGQKKKYFIRKVNASIFAYENLVTEMERRMNNV